MQRELRRYENRLVVIGSGMIGIGLWSLIKVILSLFMDERVANSIKESADDMISEALILAVLLIIVVLVVGWHLAIGLSARSEGYGKRSSWAYLVSIALLIAFYIFSMKAEIDEFDTVSEDPIEMVISLLIDGSVCVTLAELFHAAIRVKLYRRKLRKMEAA